MPRLTPLKQSTVSTDAIAGYKRTGGRVVSELVNTDDRPFQAITDYSNNNKLYRFIYSIAKSIRSWVISEQNAEFVGIKTIEGSLALVSYVLAYGSTTWLNFKNTYNYQLNKIENGHFIHKSGTHSVFYAPDTAVYSVGAYFEVVNLIVSASENMYLELRVSTSSDGGQTWGNEITIGANSGSKYGQLLESGYEKCTVHGETLVYLKAGQCLRVGIFNYSNMANAIQDMTELEYRCYINKERMY